VRCDITFLIRVSVLDSVVMVMRGMKKEFFYMYLAFFVQLHVWLLFEEFTMSVLHPLNVAPTQLHLNS